MRPRPSVIVGKTAESFFGIANGLFVLVVNGGTAAPGSLPERSEGPRRAQLGLTSESASPQPSQFHQTSPSAPSTTTPTPRLNPRGRRNHNIAVRPRKRSDGRQPCHRANSTPHSQTLRKHRRRNLFRPRFVPVSSSSARSKSSCACIATIGLCEKFFRGAFGRV